MADPWCGRELVLLLAARAGNQLACLCLRFNQLACLCLRFKRRSPAPVLSPTTLARVLRPAQRLPVPLRDVYACLLSWNAAFGLSRATQLLAA